MKKIKEIYKNISKLAFWTTLGMSVILIVVSFLLPPTGIIDASVVKATGELFMFCALGVVIDGIHRGTDIIMKKGDTSVQINNNEKEEEETFEG